MPQILENTVFHEIEGWCQLKLAPCSTLHRQPGELSPTGHQWEEAGDIFQEHFPILEEWRYFFTDKRSGGKKNNEVLRTGRKCSLGCPIQVLPL